MVPNSGRINEKHLSGGASRCAVAGFNTAAVYIFLPSRDKLTSERFEGCC
jgi:hypothetical protein